MRTCVCVLVRGESAYAAAVSTADTALDSIASLGLSAAAARQWKSRYDNRLILHLFERFRTLSTSKQSQKDGLNPHRARDIAKTLSYLGSLHVFLPLRVSPPNAYQNRRDSYQKGIHIATVISSAEADVAHAQFGNAGMHSPKVGAATETIIKWFIANMY